MDPTAEMRLEALEARLTIIENRLHISNTIFTDSHTEPQPARPSAAPLHTPSHLTEEESKSGNWLGIIAVICFVLAAGFIIKLSVESGWLTPMRQIGLAALFGFGLIGAGLRLMQSDRAYASYLPGAGIIVLYLSIFASHRFYVLIPIEVALGLTTMVSALCIWLYSEIKHDIYPITAAIGAYIAPAVMGLNASAAFALYYFAFCSLTFATISVWVRSRALILVSSYLAIGMTGLIGDGLHHDVLIALFLGLHFLIFSCSTWFYARQSGQTLSENQAWCFLPVLTIFYAMEYYFIGNIMPMMAPWISLCFACVLIALYVSAKYNFSAGAGSRMLIVAFATIAYFHSVYLELLPPATRPALFVLIMLAVAFVPQAQTISRTFLFPTLALLTIAGIEYFSMLSHLLDQNDLSWVFISLAALASMWIVIAKSENVRDRFGAALLGAAHFLAIMALYRLTDDIGSLAVSASWLFYGVAVICFAFARKDQLIARSAVFVLAFAAGKALLYDAASAPTLVRILCLLMTSVVLYGCGFFMRKMAAWKKGSAT